jgi:hypothetical protein
LNAVEKLHGIELLMAKYPILPFPLQRNKVHRL